MHHFRKTKQTYAKLNVGDTKQPVCTFCSEDIRPRIVAENGTMVMIPNRVSYDIFEGRRVSDHLMILPKRHLETLADFTSEEMVDHMKMIAQYEKHGYNVYARGVGSVSRSVKHQHTHLIKLSDKLPKGILYLKKPYFLMHV